MKKKWIGYFLVLCMLLSMIPAATLQAAAATYSGTWGDLVWSLDSSTGHLIISGNGSMDDFETYEDSTAWRKYQSSIKSVEIKSGVTSIGAGAFYYNLGLLSVTIPDSVTSIGSYAFTYCDNLTSIWIPASVTSVGTDAFYGCNGLYVHFLGNPPAFGSPNVFSNASFHFHHSQWIFLGWTDIHLDGTTVCDWKVEDFVWNTDCTGTTYRCSLCNDVYIQPLDEPKHQLSYKDSGENHSIICDKCDYSTTEAHSYVDNVCICGRVNDPYLDPNLTFFYKSMDLQSYIGVNYMVQNSVAYSYDSFYVGVKQADGAEVILEGTPMGSAFTYFSIRTAAPQMTENLAATIYAIKDGVTYHGETVNWSVRDGVMEQMNAITDLTNEANRNRMTLMVDMLNYGAAAQIRFKNRTDDLANNKLTEAQLAYATTTTPTVEQAIEEIANEGATVKIINRNLSLQSSIEVQVMVNIKDYSVEDLEARISYDGKTDVIALQQYISTYAQIIYDGIAAKDLRTPISITVYHKETGEAVSNTLSCNIEALASLMLPDQADIVYAMMRYGDSAECVFG